MPIEHTPKVDSRYGAPMGRGFRSDAAAAFHMKGHFTRKPESELAPARATWRGKVSLRGVRLDSGGYDAGGAYWGFGKPLFSALSADGAVDMIFRATSREEARREVLSLYPFARFYR